MTKITPQQIKDTFEEIVGWKYVSPGTNDENGIDCSGAWVRCYKKYGFNILHGSNSIYRKECSSVGKITSEGELQVGMMVFKNGFDNQEPDKYKGDGIGNMRHIGAITCINPIVVTHATSPVAKQDMGYKQVVKNGWSHWGIGKEVDIYGTSVIQNNVAIEKNDGGNATVITNGELQDKICKVVVDNQKPVNMRKKGNVKADLVARIPYNDNVLVTSDTGKTYVATIWEDTLGIYNRAGKTYTGYMDRNFLQVDDIGVTSETLIGVNSKADLEKRIYNAVVTTNASVEEANLLKEYAYKLFPEYESSI